MNTFTEMFKSEALFSTDNPFLQASKQAHELVFESLDKTARLQLNFARDLLDMNRKRFESIYTGESFTDTLTTQQDFVAAAGTRGLALVEDTQVIANDLQDALKENANVFVAAAQKKASPAKTAKKAKAA